MAGESIPAVFLGSLPRIYTDRERRNDMTEARKETYEQLIALGCTPVEAWALIEQMDFAEDYDETDVYCHAEDYDGE